jgi:hypothetical protein
LLSVALLATGILWSFAPSAFALFTNGNFEDGVFGPNWVKTSFLNYGLTGSAPFTGADIVRTAGGSDLTQMRGGPAVAAMSLTDANTGNVLHYPLSGHYCAVVNYQGSGRNANSLLQQSVVGPGDVAPDGKVHIAFAWAAVVQNPVHADTQQPYIYVALHNVTKGTLLYETFHFAGVEAIWHNAAGGVQYTDWQITDMPEDSSAVAVGDTVSIEAVAAGCSQGGHWGYLYVDRFGAFYPVTPVVGIDSKDFDGTTAATINSRSLVGVQTGDTVSLTGGTANFATAAAGAGKTVTTTGLSLTGIDSDRYSLTSFTATSTADIMTTPTVTSTAVSALTSGTATGGGDVSWDGGHAVTVRGVCWGASLDPTIAGSHTSDGTGAGSFTSSIAGLAESTTYHYRAYATNSLGTSYSGDTTFTTAGDPPVTTATGLTDASTWHTTTPQTVTLTADDGSGSGVAHTYYTIDGGGQQTYGAPFDISAEGPHTVVYWSVDNAGNAEVPQTGRVNIDLSAPTTTAGGLTDASTWSDGTQTVTLTVDDGSGSGAADTYYTIDGGGQQTYGGPFDIAAEGPHTIVYWSVDELGHIEVAQTGHVNIDLTKPTTTPGGLTDASTWSNGTQTVTLTADDGSGTGVDGTYYTIDGGGQQTYGAPFDISAEGPHTIVYWSVDKAGNTEDANTGHVNVDLTKPVTTADGLDDGTVWTNAARTVTLSAGDGTGSGVAHTYYTIDGAGPQLYDGSFTIDWDGTHTVTFWSVDAAGNVEDATTDHVSFDGTVPTASAEGYDAAWHRHSVAVTLRAFDLAIATNVQSGLGLPALPSSGVKHIQYRDGLGPWVTVGSDTVPVNVTTSAIHNYQYRAEDNAGNVSQVGTFTVKVDTVKPKVACITNSVIRQGQVARLRYRLADNLSTKLNCRLVITQYGKIKAVYPLGIKPVNTTLLATVRCGLKAQPYYWRVVARDAAGNERWGIHHLFIIAPRQLR